MPTWNVELRGQMTSDVAAALGREGIIPAGGYHSLHGLESHGVQVEAPTAGEAIQRAKDATRGFTVSVRNAVGPVLADT
ncbi:MAG TPA: hypothetical protein VII98_14590 [Solirubrobacteraceae bacterium]